MKLQFVKRHMRSVIKRNKVPFGLSFIASVALLGATFFFYPSERAMASLADSLVGHWEFNEGTGTAAADASSANNDGALIQNGGSPSWITPGRDGSGSALQFNGVGAQGAASSTVNVGNDASLNGLSKYILSAWVKFDPGYVGNSGEWANIIARTQGTDFSYMLYINANGHLRAHHVQSNGSVIWYDSVNVIPTGQWVHIAQIADGSHIRLIINGVEDSTSAVYDGTANSLPAANTYIGQDTREYTLLGSIDDARIYNNFAAPGGVAGGLTAWQKADDGTAAGALWTDSSGNGNDATQSSAGARPTLTSSAINFNPAFAFDGANDSFVYAGNMGIAGANNFSSLTAFRANAAGSYILFGNNGGVGNNFLFSHNASGQITVGRGGNSSGPSCGAITSTALPMGIPGIGSYTRVNGTEAKVQLNGGGEVSGACATNFTASTRMLGRRNQTQVSSGYLNGLMGEFVHYNRTLSNAELLRVQSYLAIKYGVTIDQSTPRNYVASDGTTTPWSAAVNGIYNHNITGIGRDDNSDLNQKQSRSVNPQGIVTVANGTLAADNPSNANAFAVDNSFLTFGDDNNSSTSWQSTGVTSTSLTNYQRLPRTWKVQETGTVGNVTVGLNTADPDANVPDAISGYYLLRDSNNNGSFADETPVQLVDNGSSQFSVGNINFSNGELFTFATFANEYRVDVQPADNLTGEDGDTGTFKVKLGARPSAAVTITFTSSNVNEGTAPISITIQPDDWDNYDANVVTVTGVDDSPPVGDGAVAYTIITTDVTSADTNFNDLDGSDVDDVAMFNQNNDPPGVNLFLVAGNTTTEAGGCVAIRFELLSQSSAAVTIPLSIDDVTEGTLNGVTQITIQPADWDQPQNNEVTVCGLADGVVDGDMPHNLITGDPTSSDAAYDAITAPQVADAALINQNMNNDDDGDGVHDNEENGAPNNGDANNDGTFDRLQSHVASFVSDATGDYTTLALDGVCQISSVHTSAEANQTVVDAGFEYPYGLMSFEADCGTPGFTATVRQSYFGASEASLTLRKFNPNTGTYFAIDNPTLQQLTIDGEALTKATFQITEGGALDTDAVANGTIVDPAGLAIALQLSPAGSDGRLSETGQGIWLALASGIIASVTGMVVLGRRSAEF